MMKEMWRADKRVWKPVKTRGNEYPGVDTDGMPIYSNTHFDTEEEAWTRLRGEAEAGLLVDVGNLRDAEEKIENRRLQVIASSKSMTTFLTNRENWERAQA